MVTKTKYTKELLEPIVQKSSSIADVLRHFNLKLTGGNHRHISQCIRYHNISIDHFCRKSWCEGKTKASCETLRRAARKIARPNKEVFIENAKPLNGNRITKRLIDLGWQYKCSKCGLTEWQGEPLTLHLDHINGINNDNRFENLRLLCPNCHQQTKTWGNKNKSKVQ